MQWPWLYDEKENSEVEESSVCSQIFSAQQYETFLYKIIFILACMKN